ncbi:MAG: hypothetical protein OXB95_06915 [Rhodobacteraceae bacterium]|nr:hypothetical protein [Paracoccaceae bacterium]
MFGRWRWLGCRRNAGKLEPQSLKRQFEDLLEAAGDSEEVLETRRMPRWLLLVSPEISPASIPDGRRFKAEEFGFECVGIRDLACELGINPGPPAPENSPGPLLGMWLAPVHDRRDVRPGSRLNPVPTRSPAN